MDLDDFNIVGVIFALIGAGIGIIVSKSMGSSVVMRLIAGIICAIACYFLGSKIAEN